MLPVPELTIGEPYELPADDPEEPEVLVDEGPEYELPEAEEPEYEVPEDDEPEDDEPE